MLDELIPTSKVIGKFLKTWGDREKTRAQYVKITSVPSSFEGQNTVDIALTLSKRLIAVVKSKNILHIEAGLDMIALAMAISSEVCDIDPFNII